MRARPQKSSTGGPAAPNECPERRLLQALRTGGAGFERLVLTDNRQVMASVAERGRTVRLSRVFLDAPDEVLAAVARALAGRGHVRQAARAEVRRYLASVSTQIARVRPRASPRSRPGDGPHLDRLRAEFVRVNQEFFAGGLPSVPIRLSGRMRRRNGHFSAEPLEIAISRRLLESAAAGEAERTLRHEMIHLWQWVDGRKPGHGMDFRRWARRLGIHPRATRTVCWHEAA